MILVLPYFSFFARFVSCNYFLACFLLWVRFWNYFWVIFLVCVWVKIQFVFNFCLCFRFLVLAWFDQFDCDISVEALRVLGQQGVVQTAQAICLVPGNNLSCKNLFAVVLVSTHYLL